MKNVLAILLVLGVLSLPALAQETGPERARRQATEASVATLQTTSTADHITLTNNTARIAATEIVATNAQARVAAEEITTTNNTARIAATEIVATNAQARVAAAEITITNNTARIAATEIVATNAQTRVAAAEITITNHEARVAATEIVATNAQARVAALETTGAMSALAVSGVANLANTSRLVLAPVTANVTNGQTVTVAASSYVLVGVGSANAATNTIQLAAPAYAGQVVTFMGFYGATNRVTFQDSGQTRVPASLAKGLAGDDACWFLAVDTSTWLCIGYIDNNN
jgi:hypothetical protein